MWETIQCRHIECSQKLLKIYYKIVKLNNLECITIKKLMTNHNFHTRHPVHNIFIVKNAQYTNSLRILT